MLGDTRRVCQQPQRRQTAPNPLHTIYTRVGRLLLAAKSFGKPRGAPLSLVLSTWSQSEKTRAHACVKRSGEYALGRNSGRKTQHRRQLWGATCSSSTCRRNTAAARAAAQHSCQPPRRDTIDHFSATHAAPISNDTAHDPNAVMLLPTPEGKETVAGRKLHCKPAILSAGGPVGYKCIRI